MYNTQIATNGVCLFPGGVCEPHNDIKGEIARSLLYMALRYDSLNDRSATSGAETWDDLVIADVAQSEAMLLQ